MNLSSFLSNNRLEHQRPERSRGDLRKIFHLFQSVVVTRAGDLDCVCVGELWDCLCACPVDLSL